MIPHEKNPQAWPQPDYFSEALKLTAIKADERYRTLGLQGPPSLPSPALIVVPVQTQAFGFGPAFRAVIGARLDHELAARGAGANRQPDVVDGYGPFARRFEDAVIDTFAAQHPRSKLLALYIGHDGISTAFVTLVLKTGDKRVVAHRSLALVDAPLPAINALAGVLPEMLAEVGFGAGTTPSAKAAAAPGCSSETWSLRGLEPGVSAPGRACHALAVGSLLPDFETGDSMMANAMSPAKLAWLASAWVEAGAQSPPTPTALAIRDIAWAQLKLGEPAALAPAFASSGDPVVAPLARLLTARARSAAMPVRSKREESARYIEEAVASLPPFARAVFVERAAFDDAFGQVDFCAIEREMVGVMVRAACTAGMEAAAPKTGRSASRAEAALFQEWRIAAHYKDITYYGRTLGQRDRLATALAALPADVAAHPFVQQQRFTLERFDSPTGSFDAYLQRVRVATTSFVQSTANLQNYDMWLAGYSLTEHAWSRNTNVMNDDAIRAVSASEARLLHVLRYDRFNARGFAPNRRLAGTPAVFLSPLPIDQALLQARFGGPNAAAFKFDPVAAGLPKMPPVVRAFSVPWAQLETGTRENLEERVARRASDMNARVELAVLTLKEGGTMKQAHALIEAQPVNQRVDEQVAESHRWARPGHALYFAAEPEAAKRYYERVLTIGTGSDSDLHARARLRQIEGDIPGAMAATESRINRYDNDFARRDMAALLFMTRQPDKAWQIVLPRLANTSTFQLWVGAHVGHRIAGLDLRQTRDWIATRNLQGAQINFQDSGAMYLHLNAITDRIPSEDDIALLREPTGPRNDINPRWASSATLVRMALTGSHDKARFEQLKTQLAQTDEEGNNFMLPLFAWVAWQATDGKDPMLEPWRQTTTTRWNLDALLARGMVLALEGNTAESLRFVTAARYELSGLGLGRMVDRPVPAPYQFVLALHLMHQKTGNDTYRSEALSFARAYQKVFPFLGWTYSVEALLSREEGARALAQCRAQYLDPQSYFLKLAAAAPSKKPTACKPALW